MRQRQIQVQFGKPIRTIQDTDIEVDQEEPSYFSEIRLTIEKYQGAITSLLIGKYASYKDLLRAHLRQQCNIYVFICNDGILIRYDEVIEGIAKVRAALINMDLQEFAPKFTDGVLHFPKDMLNYSPTFRGPQIVMSTGNINNPQSSQQQIFSAHYEICAQTTYPVGFEIKPPPNRPVPIVSLANELILNLDGEISPASPISKELTKDESFFSYSRVKLDVGWLAIEVYPLTIHDHWKPEYATLWAELDILAIIAEESSIKAQLNALDSRVETRKKYSKLFTEFESLMTGPEEPLHQFIKSHPELLCPTHEKCWSKVQFGKTISDFVFREAYNDYLLVEIEAPIRELFRKDGQQRQELTHAINQITDWVQHIQANKQKVEEETGLAGISTNPRILVVIGRRESLSDENRRKIESLQAQQNKLRIMTYDDVILNAKESLSRILGNFDIHGENMDIFYYEKK
jgi:hypothetical protein